MKPRDITIVTLGAILCLTAIAPLSHSQSPNQESIEAMRRERNQRRRERREQWQEEIYQQIKRLNEQAECDGIKAWEETRRQAVGAAPAQWRVIKPRLDALEALIFDAHARIRPQISYSTTETPGRVTNCQWRWARSAEERPDAVRTPTETTCETLLEMLSNEQAPIDEIWEQVEVLRRQRKQEAGQMPDAREELRKVLTLRQEAALMVQGRLR